MKRLFAIPLFLFISIGLSGQTSHDYFSDSNTPSSKPNDKEYSSCSYWSIDIPSSTWGISFGNSKNFSGIRFNFRECNVERVNGFNFTLWEAKSVRYSEVNGISLGVVPHASRLNGLNVGFGLISEEQMNGLNLGVLAGVSNGYINGINIGGLALVSNGSMLGINFGGLALVSNGDIGGINFGGLAQVANGNLIGINFGGLALVANKNLTGLNFGGLALVSDGELSGINLSLLASVSNDNMSGINISGLALVSSREIKGVNLGGLAVVGAESMYGLSVTLGELMSKNEICGLSVSGYKTETGDFTGMNFTIAWTEMENLRGFSFAAYNRIYGEQKGLTIGIVNFAEELSGVQLGLINIANNNSGIFKILPFINAHF